jgi:hypothetical protein
VKHRDRYDKCAIPDGERCQARCPDAFLRERERPRCVNHAALSVRDVDNIERRVCRRHAANLALEVILADERARPAPRVSFVPPRRLEFIE